MEMMEKRAIFNTLRSTLKGINDHTGTRNFDIKGGVSKFLNLIDESGNYKGVDSTTVKRFNEMLIMDRLRRFTPRMAMSTFSRMAPVMAQRAAINNKITNLSSNGFKRWWNRGAIEDLKAARPGLFSPFVQGVGAGFTGGMNAKSKGLLGAIGNKNVSDIIKNPELLQRGRLGKNINKYMNEGLLPETFWGKVKRRFTNIFGGNKSDTQ